MRAELLKTQMKKVKSLLYLERHRKIKERRGIPIDAVRILLEEYKTLRQESLTAMNKRNIALSFGLAAIGAILTGSILAYEENECPII